MIYTVRTKEIKRTYEYWKTAMIKGDLASLDELYSENFSWTNEFGIRDNKTQTLRKTASGNLQYLSWINKSISIKIAGDTAILKTREILKLQVYNQRVNTIQDVTAIFVNKNGRWLMTGGQELMINTKRNKNDLIEDASI